MRCCLIRLGVAALALVGFLGQPPRASAETITLKFESEGSLVPYNPYGGPTMNAFSGPFGWSQVGSPNPNFPQTLYTYCIDKDQFIELGQTYTFTVQTDLALAPTIGTGDKASAITELFDRYYLSSQASEANQHAFQLALWDLVHDGADSRSMSEGRIQANNQLAQDMLSSLGTPYSNHDLTSSRLVALVSETYQDQIVVIHDPPSGVPAPPGLVLAGVGVGALLARRWLHRPTA